MGPVDDIIHFTKSSEYPRVGSFVGSFFKVTHKGASGTRTIDKNKFLEMGRHLWQSEAVPFDSVFTSERQKRLATHLMLNCQESGQSIHREALKRFVQAKSSFFGSPKSDFFASYRTLEPQKEMLFDAASVAGIFRDIGLKNADQLVKSLFGGRVFNEKVLDGRLGELVHKTKRVPNGQKGDYFLLSPADLTEIAAILQYQEGDSIRDGANRIQREEKRWFQSSEDKGRVRFLQDVNRMFLEKTKMSALLPLKALSIPSYDQVPVLERAQALDGLRDVSVELDNDSVLRLCIEMDLEGAISFLGSFYSQGPGRLLEESRRATSFEQFLLDMWLDFAEKNKPEDGKLNMSFFDLTTMFALLRLDRFGSKSRLYTIIQALEKKEPKTDEERGLIQFLKAVDYRILMLAIDFSTQETALQSVSDSNKFQALKATFQKALQRKPPLKPLPKDPIAKTVAQAPSDSQVPGRPVLRKTTQKEKGPTTMATTTSSKSGPVAGPSANSMMSELQKVIDRRKQGKPFKKK